MKKNKNLFIFLLSILCIVIVWGVSKYARKSYMRDADKAGKAELSLSAEPLSPKPIVYLESYSNCPSGLNLGSWKFYCWNTNPFFVLYNDGLVIYKKNCGDCKFFSVELSPEEMNAFLKEINPDDEFFKLDSDYDAFTDLFSELGDQISFGALPFCMIRLWHGNTMKQVRILGSIEASKTQSKVPDAFLKIADRLYSFDHPDAHLWQPEKIMVSAWPTNVPDDNLILWPYDWPDLYDEAAKEFKDTDGKAYYFIHMSGDKLGELDRLLSSLDGNSAILINGKEFFVKVSHYYLPAEELFEDIYP